MQVQKETVDGGFLAANNISRRFLAIPEDFGQY